MFSNLEQTIFVAERTRIYCRLSLLTSILVLRISLQFTCGFSAKYTSANKKCKIKPPTILTIPWQCFPGPLPVSVPLASSDTWPWPDQLFSILNPHWNLLRFFLAAEIFCVKSSRCERTPNVLCTVYIQDITFDGQVPLFSRMWSNLGLHEAGLSFWFSCLKVCCWSLWT